MKSQKVNISPANQRQHITPIAAISHTLCLCTFLLAMIASFHYYTPTTAYAASQNSDVSLTTSTTSSAKNGIVKENGCYHYYRNGKLQKNIWKSSGGYKYYFKSNGNAATYSCKIKGKYYVFNGRGHLLRPEHKKLYKVGNKKYYVNSKGNPVTGWQIIKSKLYYVQTDGSCLKSTTKDHIKLNKECYAVDNTASLLKITVMNKVAELTNSKMTRTQKLRACFNYSISNYFQYQGNKRPDFSQSGWKRACALDMLTTGRGNCFGYACAFAALAKELGYQPYLIDGMLRSRHCWVQIDGKFYDRYTKVFASSTYPRQYTVLNKYKF